MPNDGVELHGISRDAFNLIVEFEVSSKSEYNRKYRHPIKPGGESGITIGIGYDCGYSTAAQIRSDWGAVLPQSMVDVLVTVAGLKKANANRALLLIRNKVDVPWEAALAVFSNTSLPKYLAMADNLPNWDKLSPDCKGALVSLVYNRGASFNKSEDRYREMRNIKAHMAASRFSAIPAEFRSMKRIWAGDESVKGLLARRDREAALFERGLKSNEPLVAKVEPPVDTPLLPNKPPVSNPPQPQKSFWANLLIALANAIRKA